MGLFKRTPPPMTEEEKIRAEIFKRANDMAELAYRKDVQFRALKESDFTYAVMEDLMKTAKLTGKVTVKFVNGTEIVIENKEAYAASPREQLEEMYKQQLI